MVKVKKDLTGMQFGRLIVLKQVDDYVSPSGKHFAKWLCKCECKDHNLVEVISSNLLRGTTKSCGCLQKELATERIKQIAAECNSKYKRKENPVDLSGEYGIGWTLNTGAEFYFNIEDYDKIKDYCWNEHILTNGYHALEARDKLTNKIVRMHWILVGKYYDHEDRNPLNNRRNNLRKATQQKNAQNSSLARNNTSGYTGVYWSNRDQKWIAYIRIDKKPTYLGAYNLKTDAIKVRLTAELKYYGPEFSPQRHLFEQYEIKEDRI